VATQYAPSRCTPDAAAQLQPIPNACGAQRALLPIVVGAMNINELMNINDVRESAIIFQRPCKLTFWPWKWCPSHMWRGLPVCQFWSSYSLSALELFPMYSTDRQTDVREHHRLMPPRMGGGGIKGTIIPQ